MGETVGSHIASGFCPPGLDRRQSPVDIIGGECVGTEFAANP
jgi:hypothetical protein